MGPSYIENRKNIVWKETEIQATEGAAVSTVLPVRCTK
jgi:hypothetical protein